MLSNRWHLAWLAVCFLAATAGAFFIVFMLVVDGLPGGVDDPIEFAGFLLAFYTLPLAGLYVGGIVGGLAVRATFRFWSRPASARTGARWSVRRLATVKR